MTPQEAQEAAHVVRRLLETFPPTVSPPDRRARRALEAAAEALEANGGTEEALDSLATSYLPGFEPDAQAG